MKFTDIDNQSPDGTPLVEGIVLTTIFGGQDIPGRVDRSEPPPRLMDSRPPQEPPRAAPPGIISSEGYLFTGPFDQFGFRIITTMSGLAFRELSLGDL